MVTVEAGEARRRARARAPSAARARRSSSSAGHDRGDLGAPRPPRLPSAASAPGLTARSGAQRQGQHPRAPLAGLRGARAPRAAISTPAPRLEVGAELGGAGDDVAAVGDLAVEHGARRSRRPPPRSPTRASASAPAPAPSSVVTMRSDRRRRARPRRAAGSAARRPRCRRPAARPSSTPSPPASSFLSWSGEAAATASTALERSIRATLASERARRGARDRGQAGARLDRLGERVEAAGIGVALCRVSFAFIAAGWHRLIAVSGGASGRARSSSRRDLGPVVVDDHQADHDADQTSAASTKSERKPAASLLPGPAVGAQRGRQDQADEGDQADHPGAPKSKYSVPSASTGARIELRASHDAGDCRGCGR